MIHDVLLLAGFIGYADGVDIVKNALGLFAGKRSIVVFILCMLALPAAERLQMHNLHVATVAFASDCKEFGYCEVYGGDPLDAQYTSVGGSMRRYRQGITHNTPDGLRKFTGGLENIKGDNPQVSALLSLKEAFNDTVFSPCKQCMVRGEQFLNVDLQKSYLDKDTPATVR